MRYHSVYKAVISVKKIAKGGGKNGFKGGTVKGGKALVLAPSRVADIFANKITDVATPSERREKQLSLSQSLLQVTSREIDFKL